MSGRGSPAVLAAGVARRKVAKGTRTVFSAAHMKLLLAMRDTFEGLSSQSH